MAQNLWRVILYGMGFFAFGIGTYSVGRADEIFLAAAGRGSPELVAIKAIGTMLVGLLALRTANDLDDDDEN